MQTNQYLVQGMTCGHCVEAVRSEVSAIPGVSAVVVDLVVGGASTLTIESEVVVPTNAVESAVDEAGYQLVDSTAV